MSTLGDRTRVVEGDAVWLPAVQRAPGSSSWFGVGLDHLNRRAVAPGNQVRCPFWLATAQLSDAAFVDCDNKGSHPLSGGQVLSESLAVLSAAVGPADRLDGSFSPPGYNLHVRGPANWPEDGIRALEGIVETDWGQATFTMNWTLSRPLRVIFERGKPICTIVPGRLVHIERFRAEIKAIGADPVLNAAYRRLSLTSRCARWPSRPDARRTSRIGGSAPNKSKPPRFRSSHRLSRHTGRYGLD